MQFKHQITVFFSVLLFSAGFSYSQSSNQNFPTLVTTNEIVGTVPARDVGDSRLTTYYYGFDGDQGDVFINLVTKNFTGDIDVFLVSGLKSLTKVVVYADLAENETGRVIYLRKPEKLLLRIQGRSPNDDPASFRVKFAGSFVASKDAVTDGELELPIVVAENENGVRVNSVGTIVEVLPRPIPSPKSTVVEKQETDENDVASVENNDVETKKKKEDVKDERIDLKTPLEVVVSDPLSKETESVASKPVRSTIPKKRTVRSRKTRPKTEDKAQIDEPKLIVDEPKVTSDKSSDKAETKKVAESKIITPDPLGNINLVIVFKDGKTIQRPMSEVFRFSVDKGVLTVVSKNGSIGRYSIFEVSKVTIE